MKKLINTLAVAFMAAFVLGLASGCKSTEPQNESSRPWNSPRGWEHGIPGMYNEGR